MRIKKIKQVQTILPNTADIANEHTTSITDVYSCNYINNISDYSTTEQVIGKWIDGKPLYRRVYIVPTLANTGDVSINYDNTFIIQKYDIYIKNPTANVKFKLPIVGNNYINTFDDKNYYRLTVQTSSDRTAFTDNYAIIEYTKTTDEGSGS